MAERWEEIEEQIQGQARLIEVENGVERDPIECMELACKRIAEAEAEVDRMADGREETYAELEALGFKSDIQGGPEDSLVRVAKLVRERFYAHERPRIAALEAEVEKWREACNEGIGECGMLQEADGCDRERLETPEQVRDRLRAISEHFDDCTQEYERILGQQKRIGELKAEVERLRALVKSAFDEGMQAGGQGEYDYSPLAVDRCWAESCVKGELEGEA